MTTTLVTASSTFFPALLVEALANAIPEFERETEAVQAAIASMLWNCKGAHREHTAHHGFFSFHYEELEMLFDKKFKSINSKMKFMEVSDAWHFKAHSSEGYTKGYRPTPSYAKVLNDVLSRRSHAVFALMDARGRRLTVPPRAIASIGINGTQLKRWKFANDSLLLNRVPVNARSMETLLAQTESMVEKWNHELHWSNDPELVDPNFLFLDSLRDQLKKLLLMAHSSTGGTGFVPHRYQEARSGRLYAQGAANLQNAPKIMRQAALEGFFDYDIANCHFSILLQMAAKADVICPAIEAYLKDKVAVREQLAKDIGITEVDAKKALLALMYGTQLTTYYKNAIPMQIGHDKARELYAHPLFAGLAQDIKLANRCILPLATKNGNSWLVNGFGNTVDPFDMRKNQQIAHLTQGVEAMALHTCLAMHLDSIVVLQHDGFTSMREIAKAPLEEAIFATTGFKLTLEMKKVSPDYATFNHRSEPSHHSLWTRTLR